MRVLIVDDSQDAADTLAILLRRWGHEVRVAYDGASAVKSARQFRPQVALLDIEMPRISGADVAVQLRRQVDGIAVVATSATDPDDERLERYYGVFDSFLSKPYDLDMLQDLLAGCSSCA